ncbi:MULTISPECIES: cytochrome c oxidase subunit 3 [Azospirillum]|uniref:cytochrome c oxidase subunit 3 n=1 Tax=Azospirillum baldaniorum TaxID=1064539 RepID=UPI0011A2A228|nr:cytochrome c oxidase subunit 3 [Azospirillum baldaniorum]TWA69303.1 heme/copper-type cytochrome/quinol oxidase subunit 3 [Azospirillum baldaniorum]
MSERHFVRDVSDLPTHGHGPSTLTWWGTMGFMLIEGFAFVLAGFTYLYIMMQFRHWPPGMPPPDLTWGTLMTAALLLSLIPNVWAKRVAEASDLRGTRRAVLVMLAVGLATLGIRWFEFTVLNALWDSNAYGSILWTILGLHTVHLLTDVGDTAVLAVLMFTRHGKDPRRMGDVTDNALYWNFVVGAWVPIYALLYLVPRFA